MYKFFANYFHYSIISLRRRNNKQNRLNMIQDTIPNIISRGGGRRTPTAFVVLLLFKETIGITFHKRLNKEEGDEAQHSMG